MPKLTEVTINQKAEWLAVSGYVVGEPGYEKSLGGRGWYRVGLMVRSFIHIF